MAIKKFCSRCNKLMEIKDGSYCDKCKDIVNSERQKNYNKNRYRSEDERKYHRFYNSVAWIRVRDRRLLLDNGLCQECLKNNKLTKATTVHHIEELKYAWDKRLDIDNLISLCHNCHNNIHNRF